MNQIWIYLEVYPISWISEFLSIKSLSKGSEINFFFESMKTYFINKIKMKRPNWKCHNIQYTYLITLWVRELWTATLLFFTYFFHRCFLILDKDRHFSLEVPLFRQQFEKDIAINVFKNGEWGCYIRQSVEPVLPSSQVDVFHAFVRLNNLKKKSTLNWVTGPLQQS